MRITYDGKAFIAVGDFALSSIGGTYCYCYDKKDVEDWGVTGLCDTFFAGKWTVDYVRETVRDIYRDVNGNNKRDADDYYGRTFSPRSPVNAYLWSFGGKIIEK